MDLKCIFSSDSTIESSQVRDLLEENGIPTLIKNEHTQNVFSGVKMFTGHDTIAGTIDIYVNSSDLEKGLSILENSFINSSNEINNVISEFKPSQPVSQNEETNHNFDDEKRIIYLSFLLSIFSILLFPIILNIKNMIFVFRKKKLVFFVNLVITFMFSSLGIMIVNNIIDYFKQ